MLVGALAGCCISIVSFLEVFEPRQYSNTVDMDPSSQQYFGCREQQSCSAQRDAGNEALVSDFRHCVGVGPGW